VIICTVRSIQWEKATLRDITRKCQGWLPDDWCFNATGNLGGFAGPTVKRGYLENYILPKYGAPSETRYFGIESHPPTRGMYKKFGIASAPAQDVLADCRYPVALLRRLHRAS